MTTVEDLKKALDDWWNDYNHLLGDASGDSECRQKLRQIIKRFSVFQKDHEEENAVRIEQIKDEKNTKIDALQLAILTIYKPEIEKLKRKLDEVHKVVKDNVLVPRKQLAPLKHDDFKCPKCDTLNHRIIRIITWTVLKDEIELKLVFFCEDCGHSEPVNLIKVLDEQERHKKLPPFIEKELLEATQK